MSGKTKRAIINKKISEAMREGNDEKVRKLEEAAAIDATIEEMCFYADISKDTYYRWLKEDPKLSDRIEGLRNRPVLKARQTIVSSLGDPNHAFKYMEKKRPLEWNTVVKVDMKAKVETEDITQKVGFSEAIKAYEQKRDEEIKAATRKMK